MRTISKRGEDEKERMGREVIVMREIAMRMRSVKVDDRALGSSLKFWKELLRLELGKIVSWIEVGKRASKFQYGSIVMIVCVCRSVNEKVLSCL